MRDLRSFAVCAAQDDDVAENPQCGKGKFQKNCEMRTRRGSGTSCPASFRRFTSSLMLASSFGGLSGRLALPDGWTYGCCRILALCGQPARAVVDELS